MIVAAKDRASKLLEKQPEDSSYDEIIRELIFDHLIENGLDDSKNNRITSHDDLKKEISSWSS